MRKSFIQYTAVRCYEVRSFNQQKEDCDEKKPKLFSLTNKAKLFNKTKLFNKIKAHKAHFIGLLVDKCPVVNELN